MEIFGHDGDAAAPWSRNLTGRYLVILDESDLDAELSTLEGALGCSMTRASEAVATAADLSQAPGAIVFERLGIAVVDAAPEQVQSLAAASDRRIVEPERYVYALTAPVLEAPAVAWDPKVSTWGLQATGVVDSKLSGKGVKVAILDTGFDLSHPDFAGRTIVSESFVPGESAQDGHGHGTHCVGTSCGPRTPADPTMPRYGVAHGAEIHVGKVLSNGGSGSDSGILAGIDWAIRKGCRVVSMSLGAAAGPNQPYSQVYETVARRAAAQGTLIIAAAGNDGPSGTVGHPANCPSIMAVAALDPTLLRANFSNGTGNIDGAQVDIAGPGVDVWSSWPMPRRYRSISGTSMATPHVAGIAALFAEADPTATPMALWGRLAARSRRLNLPATQVGCGLVQVR